MYLLLNLFCIYNNHASSLNTAFKIFVSKSGRISGVEKLSYTEILSPKCCLLQAHKLPDKQSEGKIPVYKAKARVFLVMHKED